MRWSIFVTLFDKSADFERRILQFANVKNALLNVLFRMKQKNCVLSTQKKHITKCNFTPSSKLRLSVISILVRVRVFILVCVLVRVRVFVLVFVYLLVFVLVHVLSLVLVHVLVFVLVHVLVFVLVHVLVFVLVLALVRVFVLISAFVLVVTLYNALSLALSISLSSSFVLSFSLPLHPTPYTLHPPFLAPNLLAKTGLGTTRLD